MITKVESAREPKWVDGDKTAIDLMVKFSHLEQEVPFTASPKDTEKYGRDLFDQAARGEFGEILEYVAPAVPQITELPTVPQRIEMRQLKLALLNMNLLQNAVEFINSMEDGYEKERTKIEWEYATAINRNDDWVNNLLTGINLSVEGIDGLFIEAAKL